MKTCTKCREEKQATSEYFYRNKATKDGLSTICKDCDREYRKQKGAKNKNIIYDDKKVKTCSKCKKEKPATPEYFHRNKTSKDGLKSSCKECDREYEKQKRAKNKKKEFIYDDKIMKTCARCEMEKPATPEYFHRNIKLKDGISTICKECKKEYGKKYREENKESHLEYSRNHYKENKESHLEYMKKYYFENTEVYLLHRQRRKARMAELPHTLTVEEWDETLEYFDNGCAYCGDSESGLAQDHVIPISKGGPYTQENIIPACKSCNSSKHTTDLEEWYVSYRHYDEGRLNKVLDYVEVIKGVLY